MANNPGGGPQGQPGALRRAWAQHPEAIIAAVITAVAGLVGTLILIASSFSAHSTDRADDNHGSDTPTPPPSTPSSSTNGGGSTTPSPSVSVPVEPPPSSTPSASKARWRGPVTLPLSLNVTSDVGAELDGRRPGKLVGVDDDLRGDYSTTPAVLVMSGRAAETGKDLTDLDSASCERNLPTLPGDVPRISAYRGGTYCFATSDGHIGAFEMPTPPSLYDIPDNLVVRVVLWA